MTATEKRNDEGFSLIELLVTTILFSLVMIIVVSIVITATATERTVRTVSSAASAGQLVTRSMQDGISNAALPVSVTSVGSDILIKASSATSGATATYTCRAWYYSSSDQTIRTTTSTTSIGTVSNTSQRSWTLLSDGIGLIGTTAVFTAVSKGVNVSFTVNAGSTKPIAFATTITSRNTATGGNSC